MERIKAIVFDVDNTVTESCQQIKDEMSSILEKIPAEIAFISGTGVSELKRMLSSKIKREHHLLANTGTHYVIVSPLEEREILKEVLSQEQRKELVGALKILKNKYNLLPLTTEEDQIQDRNSQVTFSVLGRNAPSEKKYSYDQNKSKRLKFIEYLKTLIDEKKYEITIGGTTSIDITQKGKDKCIAVGMFMEKNKIEKNEIIFFGDQLQPGGNDYPVKKLKIKCIEVTNPYETLKILGEMYNEF
ncbi:MAG: HAD-IIB family hydrolase [Nanoarchaeota archaeon]